EVIGVRTMEIAGGAALKTKNGRGVGGNVVSAEVTGEAPHPIRPLVAEVDAPRDRARSEPRGQDRLVAEVAHHRSTEEPDRGLTLVDITPGASHEVVRKGLDNALAPYAFRIHIHAGLAVSNRLEQAEGPTAR